MMVHPSDGVTSEAEAGVRGSRIALAGLVFSALFLLPWFLLRGAPPFDATDDQMVAYYGDSAHRREAMIVGLYVIPLAGARSRSWTEPEMNSKRHQQGWRRATWDLVIWSIRIAEVR